MAKLVRSKRFTGVYYRESAKRKHRGKPDRIWWVAYPSPGGKTSWQRVGTSSGGMTDALAARKREKFMSTAPPAKTRHITVADAVASYVAWRIAEGKDHKRDLAHYNRHMADAFGALPISSITPAMLTEHKARLQALGTLGEQSILHAFAFCRAAVYHAEANGEHQGANPFRSNRRGRFRLTPPENKRFRWFSPEEVEHILCGLRGNQLHDMSLLALHTGMRAPEVIGLKASGLEPETGLAWFVAKGKKQQSVPVEPWLMQILLDYRRQPGEHVFQARDGGPLRYGIPHAFARCLNDLGLNDGVESAMRATFHTWRHTFASWLAQSGRVTLQELQELMRHERIDMTLRYAHLIPGHQRRASSIISHRLDATGHDSGTQSEPAPASRRQRLTLVPPKRSA